MRATGTLGRAGKGRTELLPRETRCGPIGSYHSLSSDRLTHASPTGYKLKSSKEMTNQKTACGLVGVRYHLVERTTNQTHVTGRCASADRRNHEPSQSLMRGRRP